MVGTRCALVTGGNKGIGYHCVEQLRAELDESFDVVLTSRSVDLGEAATEELRAASTSTSAGAIVYHQADIASEESIEALREWVVETYGGVDILINNAGFAYQGKSEDVPFSVQALDTVDINFFGTLRICNALIPLLRPHARVVNVASMAGVGAIAGLDDEKLARIRDPSMTEEQLCSFMQEFVDAAAAGDVQSQGWPENSYGMSKLGIMAVCFYWQH
jgi:carbonyl reductase 1